ncbi:MAG: hypothetical protein KAT90_10280 [Gammaproteobacteria bacterium]|nr:hypothetical protein [Gammaproteobacteria bacterium]
MARAKKDEEQSAVTEKISNELAIIAKIDPVAIFKNDGLTDVLAKIKEATSSIVPDLSTGKGRKEIASIAYKVSQSKTALDDAGKGLVAQAKKDIKLVDNERKRARDTLDTLRDAIRKPLNDWEAADAARIEEYTLLITETIGAGNTATQDYLTREPQSMIDRLEEIKSINPDDCEEFAERVAEVKADAIVKLEAAISRRQDYDRDQAELAELRENQRKQEEREAAEKAEKERKEREAEIARQARESADRERQKAEDDKKAAIARAEQAEKDAVAEAERAAQSERDKIAREQQAEADALAARERNTQHKGKLNREAVADIANAAGINEDQAKKIVIAIAKCKIRNVQINY